VTGDPTGFDRLARGYRLLEVVAFGRDLERARFAFLGELAHASDILLLGEGDGRCAERLAAIAPAARILCVDSSPGMIRRAAARLRSSATASRVTFLCADLRSYAPPREAFDAVATLFVLDCFSDGEVAGIVGRVAPSLRPGARWLFADFVMPLRGWPRLRARVWLYVLYAFFRLGAGLGVRSLPASEDILGGALGPRAETAEFQLGMIRSAVYIRS
jgi:ubiquinone/menaquinone biosynthesis C-methylase UbiE